MANFCPGIIYSVLWLLILWFIMWPVAGFLSFFYILLMPLSACLPFLKGVCETLNKWIQYCQVIGENIKGMKGFDC